MMMDKPTENPDEDRVSLKSGGKTPTNGAVKETLGMFRSTLRNSIQRVAEKSPLSPRGKGSKVTPKAGAAGNESGSQPPPSPSEYCHGCREICCEIGFAGRYSNMSPQGQRSRKEVRFVTTSCIFNMCGFLER